MILYPQGRSNWVAAPQNDTFLDREDRQMDERSHAILSILQDLGLAGEPSGLAGRPSDLAGWPLGGDRMVGSTYGRTAYPYILEDCRFLNLHV